MNSVKLTLMKLSLAIAVSLSMACAKKNESKSNSDDGGNANVVEGIESVAYMDQPAQGLIDGQPWVINSGTAKPNFMNPDQFDFQFSDKVTTDPCQSFQFGQKEILTQLPNQVGESILGQGSPMKSATFFVIKNGVSENQISVVGKFNIQEVTAQEVIGQMFVYGDDNNIVNGTFRVALCTR
jgi:hypothetical protein